MFKQEKGITLVALVITIIVLLILAGVSLSMVMGDNSVLGRGRQAVDSTEISSVKDEIGLAVGSAQTNYYAKYANGTGRTTLGTELVNLVNQKNSDNTYKEFPAAKVGGVTITAKDGTTSGQAGTYTISYELPNGNKYGGDITVTEASINVGEITKTN